MSGPAGSTRPVGGIEAERAGGELLGLVRPLVLMRLAAAAGFFLFGFLRTEVVGTLYAAALAAFVAATVIPTLEASHRLQPRLSMTIQIMLDVAVITVLIYASGKQGSLFVFVYLLPVLSACLLLTPRRGVLVGAASGMAYAVGFVSARLPLATQGGGMSAFDLAAYTTLTLIVFLLVGFLCAYLVGLVRSAGERLDALRSLHDVVLESMSSGVITIGGSGRIVYANRAAGELLGFSAEELHHRSVGSLFFSGSGPQRVPFVAEESRQAGERESRTEIFGRCRDGREIPVGYNVSPIASGAGGTMGHVMVFADLTQVKVLESKLWHAEKMKTVGELAAGLAHEIRNPLAAITGSIEMLAVSPNVSKEDGRLLRIMLKESERLNGIIEEFLQYGREGRLDMRPVRVVETLHDVVSLLRNDPRFRPAVEFNVTGAEGITIHADEAQLKQVFFNLLRNASEAMPDGGCVRIRVAPSAGGERMVNIEVADTGRGIAPSALPRIFEPFYSTKQKGMGIGLSIADKIIRTHGGEILVESVEGEGSTFTVRLPCVVPAALEPVEA